MNKYFKVILEDNSEFYVLETKSFPDVRYGTIIHIVTLGKYNADLHVKHNRFWHVSWCHDVENEMISFLDKVTIFQ